MSTTTPVSSTRLRPRGGTIFWGVVLLLIASIAGVTVVFGSWTTTATVWLVVAFGALLVVAALIGAVARAVSHPEAPAPAASTDRLTADSTDAPLT